MPPVYVNESKRQFEAMSPETIEIIGVCTGADIQGHLTCNLKLSDGPNVDTFTLQSRFPKKILRFSVILRRNAELVIHCSHKRAWNKPAIKIPPQRLTFGHILRELVTAFPSLPSGEGLCTILHIELDDPPQNLLKFWFKLPPTPGPAVEISMARVNHSLTGRGFHYIGFRLDGSTMFQRKLTAGQYPQEYPLSPPFSFHPQEDLRLCLFRRPYYIWPVKKVVKSSSFSAADARRLISGAAPGIVEHNFPDIPVTIHLVGSPPPSSPVKYPTSPQMQNFVAVPRQRPAMISRPTSPQMRNPVAVLGQRPTMISRLTSPQMRNPVAGLGRRAAPISRPPSPQMRNPVAVLGQRPSMILRPTPPQMQNSIAILDQSAATVSRRTRILDGLGTSRTLLENIAKCASSASEMHPIAKTVVQGLGFIYNTLAQVEAWDEKLLDLLEDMGSLLNYIDHIEGFATIDHFQQNLKGLDPIIRRTGNLILKYPKHGLSFLTGREAEEYEDLRATFERYTRKFQRGVAVEALKGIGTVQDMMREHQEFFRKHRRAIVEYIRPPGADRMRPISGCLEGTRKRIFAKIDTWLADRNSPNILWIKGSPGSGKSCIAQSVVERLTSTNSPGASFFFERDSRDFTAPSTMLRAIATALCHYPVFLEALAEDLEKRTVDFSHTSVEEQFRRLVEMPLQRLLVDLPEGSAVVVVVDALDECGGREVTRHQDRDDVLKLISRWSKLSPALRLVVTSRDEAPIFAVLHPISTTLKLKLDGSHATEDVEAFLTVELKKIGTDKCLADWPSRDDIRALAAMAKGLFIWAATLVGFLDRPKPQDTLRRILSGELNVQGPINDLYRLILHMAFCERHEPDSEFLAELIAFLGAMITANRPLAKDSPLFKIIRVEFTTVDFICQQLRPVMIPDRTHLRFNHQSFVDFLVSENCPIVFRIDLLVHSRNISLAILRRLNQDLDFDLTEIRTSYRSNESNAKGMARISEELSFACRAWGDTLPTAGVGGADSDIMADLKIFLETKFLFWLEVLSLTNQMSCALPQLQDTEKMIGVSEYHSWSNGRLIYWNSTRNMIPSAVLVADAIAFVQIFQDCIGKSAPHIYLSAMAVHPGELKDIPNCICPYYSLVQRSPFKLRTSFGKDVVPSPAPIIYVASGNEFAEAVEGHVDEILSVQFIQDGYVASASYDGTIRFWDPTLGAPILTPLANYTKAVTALAFSQDRIRLVSGCRNGEVVVWNMEKHEILTTFSHGDAVTCVAISSSGRAVVAGGKDGTVTFWDVRHRQELKPTFGGHTQRVTAVAFLDNETVVSASLDKSIFLHPLSGNSELLVRAQKRIYALTVSLEPRSLIGACCSCVSVWPLSDENVPRSPIYLAKNSHELRSLAVHGSRVAAAVQEKIQIWDLVSRKLIMGPFNDHRGAVTSLAFSKDGERLVSGSVDRSVRVWNTAVGDEASLGGFPDGCTLDPVSGWIRGPEPKCNLMIWVPESHRRRLCWGRTLAVMNGKPSASLTLIENILGKRWYKCRL
ncbi:hypothetical protein C8R46DRAFT_1303532 [Mycena filopes]|nr:hypothetical protein C8R46DRAFT_1303532 [Mycena filopes]